MLGVLREPKVTLLLELVPNAVDHEATVVLVVDVDVDMVGSMADAAVAADADVDIDTSFHVSVLPGTVTLVGAADDTGGVGKATAVLKVK